MSDSGKAVFLSYASQDAEAAKRICEALRAAGVEVWFDQSELVGGDQWDQKIRGQIGTCALFMPIISANTQARLEGYFRIEWKVAGRRTHAMATAKAFLLPVVIDDTHDASAHVPDEFRDVQWTRLPGGETPPAFARRVKKLLGGGPNSREAVTGGSGTASPELGPPRGMRPSKWWWGLPMFGVTMALVLVLKEQRTEPAPAPAPALVVPQPTEAQKLTARARALVLHDRLDEVTREELALAEQLLKRAVELDPVDGEAWAAYAQCTCGMIALQYDSSQARRQLAISEAEKALKLAPDSLQAQFAWAMSYRYQDSSDRSEVRRLHRELAERAPTDKRVLRQAGRAYEVVGLNRENDSEPDREEALRYYDRAAALPGGDPIALRLKSDLLFTAGRYAASDEVIDRALALRPAAGHLYTSKIRNLLFFAGDTAAAQQMLAKMPATYLLDDQGAYTVCLVWLWSRQPDKCLEALRGLTHDYLDSRYYIGPKTFLTGLAHQMAGRREAALADWRIALQKIEERLVVEPGSVRWLRWKAEVLALLGERAAAESTLQICEQKAGLGSARVTGVTDTIYVTLGRYRPVLDYFETQIATRPDAWLVGRMRYEPLFDPLRGERRFQDLLRKAEESLLASRATTEAAVVVDSKSVAVLAFANLSDDKANEYFSDGISEELLNVLAKVPGLKVTARTSSFYFKGKEVPVPEIAKQLGVAYVVEGSVRKAGDKVRISAQLIKAADGFHVWSDNFTRDLKDIFAVQDEIAGLIAKNLELKIGTSSSAATVAVNPQAFELYVQARRAWNLRNAAGFAQAEELLTRALTLEPEFARAHAALADVWTIRAITNGVINTFGQREAPVFKQIVSEIAKALALDPDSSEAHASLGMVRLSQWNLPEAERELRRAVELNPNYATAHHWLGGCLFESGRVEESVVERQRAAELDPFSLRILESYAQGLIDTGRCEEALTVLGRAQALQADPAQALSAQFDALLKLGRRAEGVAVAWKLDEADRAEALARAGEKVEAEAALSEAEGWSRYELLAALGRTEEALAKLQADDVPVTEVGSWLMDPRLDPFRKDPHFLELLTALGLTEAHARMQAWRAAHPPQKPETKR